MFSMFSVLAMLAVKANCAKDNGQFTRQGQAERDPRLDNVIFSHSLLFDALVRSRFECDVRCLNHEGCVAFSFGPPSTCRGHSSAPSPGDSGSPSAGAETWLYTNRSSHEMWVYTEQPGEIKEKEAAMDDNTDYQNVAVGKTAQQSSTFTASTASLAVDGNSNTDWRGASCSHTDDGDYSPWWYVDLGRTYIIQAVAITNRGDCCGKRLADFKVQVYENDPQAASSTAQSCYTYSGAMPQGATETLTCSSIRRGRYLRITMNTQHLTLCEVQVFGIQD